jgi:hypothetical protein
LSESSCKNCKDRYLGCHDKCEKYQKFKEERIRISQIAREHKGNSAGWDGYNKSKCRR